MHDSADQARPLACRVFGHDFVFRAEDKQLVWGCSRCPAGDAKGYSTPAEAQRLADVFNVRDNKDLGKRAPLIGLFPLRLWRKFRSGL